MIYWIKHVGMGKIMGHMAFCAEEYDAKIRQTLPFYEEFYQQVVGILEVWGREELSWLDIGCGTGKMYEAAEKRTSVREFVFTDISEGMLAVARERFQAGKNRFERMSVLELEDIEKYDVVDYFPLTVGTHFELMRECGFQGVELIWMSYMQAGFMGIKL